MTEFKETSRALADLPAGSLIGFGQHIDPNISTKPGVMLGDLEFDPTRHNPMDINHLSPLGIATDAPQVRQTFPHKPLHIAFSQDRTSRAGLYSLNEMKQRSGQSIYEGIDSALHGVGDMVMASSVDGQNRARFIDDSANQGGISFAISDFEGMDLSSVDFDQLVAIKVNHLLEREIPQNVGFISLGGAVELNTGDKKQLDKFNTKLEEHHQEIVEGLEEAGAQVVSVIVDPRMQDGFDVEGVDSSIAEALDNLNR